MAPATGHTVSKGQSGDSNPGNRFPESWLLTSAQMTSKEKLIFLKNFIFIIDMIRKFSLNEREGPEKNLWVFLFHMQLSPDRNKARRAI